MQHVLIFSLVAILASCSVLTGADESNYVEFYPDERCQTDNDCSGDGICPTLLSNLPVVDRVAELEKTCRLGCKGNPSICEDTLDMDDPESSFPFCYQLDNGAICLGQVTLTGQFSCPIVGQGQDSQLNLTLGNGQSIPLTECEIWREGNQLDIIVGASLKTEWYQVIIHLGSQNLGQGLDASNAFGIVGKSQFKQEGADYQVTRTDILGFFTRAGNKPNSFKSQITLTNSVSLGTILDREGVLTGTILLDGYAYEAQIPPEE